MALVACGECGREISDKAAACPQCGAPPAPASHAAPDPPPVVPHPPHPERMRSFRLYHAPPASEVIAGPAGKNRALAVVLALVLGSFGAHKFYLGSVGLGVVYLLLFWTYIPGVIGFIEGLYYALIGEAEFQLRYGGAKVT